MTARDGLFNHLTGRSLCPPPRPAEEATGLIAAHRDEVRADTLDDVADLFDYRSRSLAPDAVLTAADVASLIRQHAAEQAGKDTGDAAQAPAGESTQAAPDRTTRVTEYGLLFPDDNPQTPYLDGYRDRPQAEAVAVDHPDSQIVQRTVTRTTSPWAKAGEAAPRAHAPSVPGTCARARGTYDWVNGTTPERETPCRPYPELNCVASCLDAEAPEGGEPRG